MRLRCTIVLAALLFVLNTSSHAGAGLLSRVVSAETNCSGNDRNVFEKEHDGEMFIRGVDSIKLPSGQLDYPMVPASLLLAERSQSGAGYSNGGKKMLVSILLSAVLPGMGETYLYTQSREVSTIARVPLFIAAEIYFWHGYFHNHGKGKDYKQYYMDYADSHWDLDRFLLQHPCCSAYGGCDDYNFYNENCQGEFNYFLFTPKGIDEEEYYENIGKYDAFVYGWDDWNGQTDYWTPHRSYYWDLRKRSDYYLKKGDNFLMFLLLNRVVSMVDAGWLAYKLRNGENPNRGLSIRFNSAKYASYIEVGYRF